MRRWRADAGLLLALALAHGVARGENGGTGYSSVAEAFRAQKANPRASVTVAGDWMVFSEESAGRTETWRFTRPGHPAHPSVLKRVLDIPSGESETAVLCEARDRSACAPLETNDAPP